jgi:short-subunit dehydrogenase
MTAKYTGEAFRSRFGPWAVVAGGSDGIGAAFGEALARRGLDVVLIGRSEAKLAHQVARIGALHPVTIRSLVADLTAPDIGVRVAEATADLDVGLFIYNAGSGREMGSFLDHPVENWLRQVHLACCGPLLLSHHFGGRLRSRGRGGIVLMSSLASLVGSAYIATYAAAKAFDTILGEGLWNELGPAGIDVLSSLAGATDTETFRADTGGLPNAMDPLDVADGTLDFLGRGPIYVPGASNQAGARATWPVPRIPLINAMSQINARSFDLPFAAGKGSEFGDA